MAEVRVMVRGKPRKEKFDFYIDPADLEFIEATVTKGWVESVAEFLRHAVRHYEDVIRAINEAADEQRYMECARIRKRIYGDGENKKQ